MSYQPMPTEPPRKAGGVLTWLGVVIIVASIGAGAALFVTAQQRFDTRVKNLAAESGALSGCITDLNFSKTGTFVLYYLSDGRVRVNGTHDGCADGDAVDLAAKLAVPTMDVTVTDDNGDTVKLNRTSLDTRRVLSAGGVKAVPYRQVTIKAAGDYQIEITAADGVARFAIGLGPKIEEPSLLLPILLGAAGAAVGLLLIIIGGVRRSVVRRRPTGTAVGYGYPAPPGFQGPGQYPSQPPVVYQPPTPQGFDHPTQSMPPIVASPEPVGPFGRPPSGPAPSDDTQWRAPGPAFPPQALPPPRPPSGPPTSPAPIPPTGPPDEDSDR